MDLIPDFFQHQWHKGSGPGDATNPEAFQAMVRDSADLLMIEARMFFIGFRPGIGHQPGPDIHPKTSFPPLFSPLCGCVALQWSVKNSGTL